jgi:hypothetical protein
MKNKPMDRRYFLKTCVAAAVGALPAGQLFSGTGKDPAGMPPGAFDAKGLPTRVLGKSGIAVPIIGIGAGSRFCRVEKLEDSVALLTTALDNGLYYWDTAPNYATPKVISEERLGLVLKDRRKEVLVATKVEELTADGAMRGFEHSLKRLQTDYVDILQVHSVDNLEEVEKIGGKGGAFEALRKLKEQKAVRLIGFSCHSSAATAMAMVERLDLDTMLIALNHQQGTQGDMEKAAIPAAAKKGMGVMIIKAIRPRETVAGLNPEDLIRYALTLEHVNSAVIGTDSLEVLKKNLALLRSFQKMTPAEMREMSTQLRPFFEGRGLPWMQPGYRDGQPS